MTQIVAARAGTETRQLLAERAHARGLQWLAGEIGEATFLRSLMIYGASLEEAKHELQRLREGP